MSYRIANSDTTLSSVTGWDTVTNTPTIHASTNIFVSSSPLYTATFTAPNTTNKCTGVALLMSSTGYNSSGNTQITVTLQENTVDTAATKTVTFNTTALNVSISSWVYIQFTAPYTFTSTTAGYYRFKITRGGVSTAPSLRSDSGASNFAFMATDDRTGAVASTDDLLVLGINYADTTVTWDGTQSIGSGLLPGYLTSPSSSMTLNTALYVGSYGNVVADTAASVRTTCKGHTAIAWGGSFNVGSSATEYPNTLTFRWIISPTTSGDFGFQTYSGSIGCYGAAKSSTTLWKTNYSSGVGTAADPLIVNTSVDWSVGDEIYICASSDSATNYNEGEYRFIKTKNSATSYVLSSTVGGAESALTYTHNTNAYIINLERNIVFTTDNTAKATYFYFNNTVVANTPFNGTSENKWVRFENLGISPSPSTCPGVAYNCPKASTYVHDYCVSYRPLYSGFYGVNNLSTVTINGMIICRSSSSNYMFYGQATANKTFNDCFIVDGSLYGGVFYMSSSTWNRLVMNAVRKSSVVTSIGAYGIMLCSNVTFNNCEASACGTAVSFYGASANVTFNNCEFGIKGKSAGYDISGYPTYESNVLFNSCDFGSTNFWNTVSGTSYKDFFEGSEIKFHDKNGTTNNHSWYTPYGIASACGSGLTDTLVRTPGSLNVRIAPESTSPGFSWSFLIPANVNQVVPFSGYFLKNVAMGTDVCTVSLFLPGNPITGTPDATTTLSDNVSNAWTGAAVQAVSLAAYYTGAVDSFATVVINAKSATAGAYLYCADFYNSGDTITLYDKLAGLTIWQEAKPSPIITQLSLGGIAPAVWGVSMNGLTTTGTTGKKLKDSLTTGKFLALK